MVLQCVTVLSPAYASFHSYFNSNMKFIRYLALKAEWYTSYL